MYHLSEWTDRNLTTFDPSSRPPRECGLEIKGWPNSASQTMLQAEPHHLTHVHAVSPRVVTVFDVGEDELGRAFYVMELLDARAGWHLVHTWVTEMGPFAVDAEQYVRLARLLRDTLDDFVRAEVMHRDLKPGNLFVHLDAEGLPDGLKVIDLGFAARVGDSEAHRSLRAGTPGYMAPEQILGAPQTPEVDVWSAGAGLGFVATGETPFPADACEQLERLIGSPFPASEKELESVAARFDAAHLKSSVRRRVAPIMTELNTMLARTPQGRRRAFDRLVARLSNPDTPQEHIMPDPKPGTFGDPPRPVDTQSKDVEEPTDLWTTLAEIYYDNDAATDLVKRAGIPRRRLRAFGSEPDVWWRHVKRKLEDGIVAHPDPAGRLLTEALVDHPGNPNLQRLAARR